MPGRPRKDFQQYLTRPTVAHVSHSDYVASPATAFLRYVVEAKSAIDLCIRKFPKRNDGSYTKDALDSLQHLISAMLPAVMGHFETYQRHMFAGVFDRSVYLSGFSVDTFFKKLSQKTKISLDLARIAAHRQLGISSVGMLLADSLPGWHNPNSVNSVFECFGLNRQFYSKDHCAQLSVLWQMRHSTVHTGGTITLADAQKINDLKGFGGRQAVFGNNFIFEVARKIHPIIKSSTNGLASSFRGQLLATLTPDEIRDINDFFSVKSSISVWLR